MCASPFILLLLADRLQKRKSFLALKHWNSSLWCWFICFLNIFVPFSSFMNLSFLAFSRLNVVECPIESRCKDVFFVKKTTSQIAFLAFVAVLVTTLSIWVEHLISKSPGLMTLCTPFVDPTHEAVMIKIVSCLFVCGCVWTISFCDNNLFEAVYLPETITEQTKRIFVKRKIL